MSDTLEIARRLARENPGATLPCPLCAASVGATNLEKHLGKVHPNNASTPLSASWSGRDRKMRVVTVILMVLSLAPLGILPMNIFPRAIEPFAFGAMALGMLVAAIPVWLAFSGKFKAKIAISGNAINALFVFGLVRRRVELPATLERGSLIVRKTDNIGTGNQVEYNSTSYDAKAGTYLRITDRRGKTLTLGTPKGREAGKQWSSKGWKKGKPRRWWDADIGPLVWVQLHYQLADRGLLEVRTPQGTGA